MFDTLYYRLCVIQVTKDVLTTVITCRNDDSSIAIDECALSSITLNHLVFDHLESLGLHRPIKFRYNQ